MSFTITADGDYYLEPEGVTDQGVTGVSVVYISGAYGTATVTLKYKDLDGNMQTMVGYGTSGALAVDTQTKVEHGKGIDLYLTIASANGSTDINVSVGQI